MVQYEVFTNKGTREINEDRYGVAMYGDSYCFTVADGLGGHGNGEVAAQAAVDVICTTFVDEGYSDSFFQKAFSAAQDAILREQERLQAPSRMKTTVVVLVVHKGKAIWAHVGDSRLYSFKQGMMKTRTTDHSVPQMLAISGEIKEKDIRHHPDRNRLMRVMGIRGENPRYDVSPAMRLRGDNAFLLCTDGFWELVEDADMAQLQKESTSPGAWLMQMTQKIQENGKGSEMDNYTAVITTLNIAQKLLPFFSVPAYYGRFLGLFVLFAISWRTFLAHEWQKLRLFRLRVLLRQHFRNPREDKSCSLLVE